MHKLGLSAQKAVRNLCMLNAAPELRAMMENTFQRVECRQAQITYQMFDPHQPLARSNYSLLDHQDRT
jgi:hypothetical protein